MATPAATRARDLSGNGQGATVNDPVYASKQKRIVEATETQAAKP